MTDVLFKWLVLPVVGLIWVGHALCKLMGELANKATVTKQQIIVSVLSYCH